jgi:hypothetical protein
LLYLFAQWPYLPLGIFKRPLAQQTSIGWNNPHYNPWWNPCVSLWWLVLLRSTMLRVTVVKDLRYIFFKAPAGAIKPWITLYPGAFNVLPLTIKLMIFIYINYFASAF